VDVSLARFLVIQAAHEEELFAEVRERDENTAQFHLASLAARPPFLGLKAVAGEEDGEAHRGFARRLIPHGLVAPHVERFLPRQCHGDAYASQKRPS
jgi:hypothetical protein